MSCRSSYLWFYVRFVTGLDDEVVIARRVSCRRVRVPTSSVVLVLVVRALSPFVPAQVEMEYTVAGSEWGEYYFLLSRQTGENSDLKKSLFYSGRNKICMSVPLCLCFYNMRVVQPSDSYFDTRTQEKEAISTSVVRSFRCGKNFHRENVQIPVTLLLFYMFGLLDFRPE